MIFLRGLWRKKPRPWGPLVAVREAVIRNSERMGIPVPVLFLIPGEGWQNEIMGGAAPYYYGAATFDGRTPEGLAVQTTAGSKYKSWQPRSRLYDISTQWTMAFHTELINTDGNNFRVLGIPYYNSSWSSPYWSWGLASGGYSDNSEGFFYHWCDGGWRYSQNDVQYWKWGEYHKYAAVRNGTAYKTYRDSVIINNGTGASNAYNWGNKCPVTIHGAHHNNYAMNDGCSGNCSLFAMWDVPLSEQQLEAFQEHPYTLVEPEPRPTYSIPPSGGEEPPVVQTQNPLLWMV